MPILHKNIIAEADIHNPKWFSGANSGDVAWKNEKGTLESTDELVLPSALNFVDASATPPTSNAGDIYVLSLGASVNAAWGSVDLKDWVRYDGAAWNSITPQKSSLCYDKTTDSLQFFDGVNWAAVATGIQNLDTATKSALTPALGDFVYDTDLDSLQRYNGSSWIDLAKGYGLIEVILDSEDGVPSYFSDLQTALETCKTSGSNNLVKLHSDIELTTAIEINQTGTGVGSDYNFDTLTIDFNGFTISNNQSDSTKVFNFNDGSTSVVQTVRFINGRILRTNATSGEAIYMKQFDVLMSDMVIDSNVTAFNTGYSAINKLLFGGSIFIGRGSSIALNTNGYFTAENFYVENTSTGTAYNSGYGCKNFTAKSGSGSCLVMPNSESFATDFSLISGSGWALQPSATGAKTITNFTIESESGSAIRLRNSSSTRHVFSNFNIVCENGVVFDTIGVEFSSFDVLNIAGSLDMGFFENCKVTNGKLESRKTSGNIMSIRADNRFENVSFIATDAEGANLFDLSGRNDSVFKNCNFTCLLDSSVGHAINISGIDGGNADFMNCTFEVVNSSANCINSGDAETITVSNCTFKGATTPINANVTITASTDLGNGNKSI
jgi:hypothetical protein